MTPRAWKRIEGEAAALFGARRFPANTGGALDFETEVWVGQVKARRALSHAELVALCAELERLGAQKSKLGVVVTYCPAGRGRKSPLVVHCTAAVWREVHGANPAGDPGSRA